MNLVGKNLKKGENQMIKLPTEVEKWQCEYCKERFRYSIACERHERECKVIIKRNLK